MDDEDKNKWDVEAGERGKKEGMTRASEHAGDGWYAKALAAVHAVCLRLAEFTSDDVWMQLEKDGVSMLAEKRKRAMGSVMRDAAARGWCTKTDRTRPTLHAKAHRRPVAIWNSRLS